MKSKNRYIKKAHIFFAMFLFGFDVEQTTEITKINHNKINRYFSKFREIIVELYQIDSPFQGEIEINESYLEQKGKRDKGARGKTIVFGLLKRNGKVYTVIILMFKSNI